MMFRISRPLGRVVLKAATMDFSEDRACWRFAAQRKLSSDLQEDVEERRLRIQPIKKPRPRARTSGDAGIVERIRNRSEPYSETESLTTA